MRTFAGYNEALETLELRIAQRADEIAARLGCGREFDRKYWLEAEREIWQSLVAQPMIRAGTRRPANESSEGSSTGRVVA